MRRSTRRARTLSENRYLALRRMPKDGESSCECAPKDSGLPKMRGQGSAVSRIMTRSNWGDVP